MIIKTLFATGLLAAGLSVHAAQAQPFTQNEQKSCGSEVCTVAFPVVAAGKVQTWSNLSCNTNLAGAAYFVFYKEEVSGKQVVYAWIPASTVGAAPYTLFNQPVGGVLGAGERAFVAAIGPKSTARVFLKCAVTGNNANAQ